MIVESRAVLGKSTEMLREAVGLTILDSLLKHMQINWSRWWLGGFSRAARSTQEAFSEDSMGRWLQQKTACLFQVGAGATVPSLFEIAILSERCADAPRGQNLSKNRGFIA